jgi:hypothetical protein
MPVAKDNMLVVMQWLASDVPGAPKVAEDLALLVFQGDMLWMNDTANADYYAETISAWVTGSAETRFTALTEPDSESPEFIDWITGLIAEWRAAAGQEEVGQDGGGLENPNYADDPTPGTQFYRYDDASGTYLYSDQAAGDDWATYEQRRYSEPAFDDGYGLGYRYDKRDEVYEWLDEESGTWNGQEWADAYAASRGAAAQGAAEAESGDAAGPATWDENWQMFYRIGADGTYQYADPVVPGDQASGCTEEWLSYEQVMARAAAPDQSAETEPAPQAGREQGEESAPEEAVMIAAEQLQNELLLAAEEAFQDFDFGDLSEDDIKRALAEVAQGLISG